MDKIDLNKLVEEDIKQLWLEDDYLVYLASNRDNISLNWSEIASILNKVYRPESQRTVKYYRDKFYRIKPRYKNVDYTIRELEAKCDSTIDEIFEEKKKKYKASDELVQANAYIRRLSREETILEIARDVANKFGSTRLLDTTPVEKLESPFKTPKKSAILTLSDWHAGLDFKNHWNTYNVGIMVKRLITLKNKVIKAIIDENIEELYVNNLGDLIAGRIHLTIRLESRIDTISQIILVSELLAEFLTEISKYTKIKYYDCSDNHSRIEPNKTNSLDLESLSRIIPWFLAYRLKDIQNIEVNVSNTYGDDIINYECRGFKIAGVHGDKDAPGRVVSNISLMTQEHYDMIVTSHLHHFSADEQNETLVISNGSLMGTDTYAKNLRLNSKPSQNLIIVSDDCVCEKLYRIVLN